MSGGTQFLNRAVEGLEQGLDLVYRQTREGDPEVVAARCDRADSVFVEQVQPDALGLHALELDAHEVAAVERVDAPALAEARRAGDLVDLLRAPPQGLVLLGALARDRGRPQRLGHDALGEVRTGRDA